jgi:hypothetical protein
MKKSILIVSAFMVSSGLFAQPPQKMSYQTVIRNATDDLVSNTTVGIQISVLQGTSSGTAVYVETHAPMTNANGLASLEIGGGAVVTGTMAAIDWGSGPYFLKSEVDIAGGTNYTLSLVSELLSVPYALHSGSSGTSQWSESGSGINTSNFTVGVNSEDPLHTLDVRSQSLADPAGLNVSNADRSRYVRFFSGSEAFPDPSMSWAPDHDLLFATFDDNTFDFSEKMRISSDGRIIAPALSASLIDEGGDRSLVTKEYVAARTGALEAIDEGNGVGYRLIGSDSLNHGNIGLDAVDLSYAPSGSAEYGATGNKSIAMGGETTASGYYDTAMGLGTTASGGASTAMGYLTTASGGRSIAMGDSSIASSFASTAMGKNTTASGSNSTAMGYESRAEATYSTAMGENTRASGWGSTASGGNTSASAIYSTAMGVSTSASGDNSTTMGSYTSSWGDNATAMGNRTIAPSYTETVIGSWNTLYNPVSATAWSPSDRLFVIGNGTSIGNKSNALTVLKNGNMGLVTATPQAKLHISEGNDTGLGNNNGFLLLGEVLSTNISIDDNEIMAKDNGDPANLNLQIEGGNVLIGGNVGIGDNSPDAELDVVGNIHYTGSISDVSDRRLKENLTAIENPLKRLHAIQGYSYNMIDDSEKQREYGVIAQELQAVFPEMVSVIDEEEGYLGVSYVQLIPVLLEAIKEQQGMIDELKEENNAQAEALKSNTALMKELQSILDLQSKK